jgi:aspartate carbamoyltransferase catalytic subunit
VKHILRAQDFDRDKISEIFNLAQKYKNTKVYDKIFKLHKEILCSLFYEPSTRTRLSFESAHLKLGGNIIGTDNAGEFSSAVKGETLEDSIKVISSYADVIVLRHSDNDAAERAAKVSNCAIINAGSGTAQHPTQSLTDLFTIHNRLERLNDIHIAIAGDLKHGRTARSLAYLLGKYDNIKISFVAPNNLQIDNDIIEYLTKHNVTHEKLESFDSVLTQVDVIYQTRLQRERHGKENHEFNLNLDAAKVSQMKENSIIMHPLPRNTEISVEVDSMPNAAYFEQASNSLPVRMALLWSIFN